MNRVLGALKATYNFFTGDAIVLSMVVAAFVIAYILEQVLPAGSRHLVSGLVFVLMILLSITLSLGRERATSVRVHRGG